MISTQFLLTMGDLFIKVDIEEAVDACLPPKQVQCLRGGGRIVLFRGPWSHQLQS